VRLAGWRLARPTKASAPAMQAECLFVLLQRFAAICSICSEFFGRHGSSGRGALSSGCQTENRDAVPLWSCLRLFACLYQAIQMSKSSEPAKESVRWSFRSKADYLYSMPVAVQVES